MSKSQDKHTQPKAGNGHAPACSVAAREAAFGYPRDFLENQFVYLAISPRAGGLSIGVNFNPVVKCTFNCLYCEIDRARPACAAHFDIERMVGELDKTLGMVCAGRLREQPRYMKLPGELLQLRHVTLSGDGEPTLARHFAAALREILHLRTLGRFPFFKIVLVTNSTALNRPKVREGLKLLTGEDEVWAKLDGGSQEYMNRLNGTKMPIEKILHNILLLGRQRPVVIQSLFPAIDGVEPPEAEIEEYAQRLKELQTAGAKISLVQIYSATRPMVWRRCSHLPLKTLSRIAQRVRQVANLRAEVF
jgi:wyosine [tRNA(Phe)-imidazoG37] synthetase (radical SAM superfamily)